MKKFKKVNVERSIEKRKLVFKEERGDIFQRIFIFLFSLFIASETGAMIWLADVKNTNEMIFTFGLMPVISIFLFYVAYRAATEKCLTKITTPYNEQQNIQHLLEYAKKNDLDIWRVTDYLVFNDYLEIETEPYKRSMVFIVRDNLILFTVFKDGSRGSIPVLISHLILKRDLKKLFK